MVPAVVSLPRSASSRPRRAAGRRRPVEQARPEVGREDDRAVELPRQPPRACGAVSQIVWMKPVAMSSLRSRPSAKNATEPWLSGDQKGNSRIVGSGERAGLEGVERAQVEMRLAVERRPRSDPAPVGRDRVSEAEAAALSGGAMPKRWTRIFRPRRGPREKFFFEPASGAPRRCCRGDPRPRRGAPAVLSLRNDDGARRPPPANPARRSTESSRFEVARALPPLAGSLARQALTIRSSAGGATGVEPEIALGSFDRIAAMSVAWLFPRTPSFRCIS